MDSAVLAFKSLAVLHGAAGYLLFGAAANDDVQQSCFYKYSNPLYGDAKKYLVYFACWLLGICGIAAFFIPKLAVAAAWASIGCYLLTGVIDVLAFRRPPSFCKACAVSLGVRLAAAVALTGLLRYVVYG